MEVIRDSMDNTCVEPSNACQLQQALEHVNHYSPTWFDLFLRTVEPAQTQREVSFLLRYLPPPEAGKVLDLCCGNGRHCEPLANGGYQVIGVDSNPRMLAEATNRCTAAQFIELDMRNIASLGVLFGGVVCLWQSFGYFDEKINTDILRQVRTLLKSNGRLVLDVYNRAFFEKHEGMRSFLRNGLTVGESKFVRGRRLFVELDYGSSIPHDRFDWQVYEPAELCELSQSLGFSTLLACTNYDPDAAPTAQAPRMQLVLEAGGL